MSHLLHTLLLGPLMLMQGIWVRLTVPALPQPLRSYFGRRATAFNDALKADIAADAKACFLDLRFEADISMAASDGFHPGPGVYSEWAARIVKIICAPQASSQ